MDVSYSKKASSAGSSAAVDGSATTGTSMRAALNLSRSRPRQQCNIFISKQCIYYIIYYMHCLEIKILHCLHSYEGRIQCTIHCIVHVHRERQVAYRPNILTNQRHRLIFSIRLSM